MKLKILLAFGIFFLALSTSVFALTVNTMTFVPSYPVVTDNVTDGTFPERAPPPNLDTWTTMVTLPDAEYLAVNTSEGAADALVGSSAVDTGLQWNITLPSYVSLNWILVNATFNSSGDVDGEFIDLWNFSEIPAYQDVYTVPNSVIMKGHAFNITGINLTWYAPSGRVYVTADSRGNAKGFMWIDYIYYDISYNAYCSGSDPLTSLTSNWIITGETRCDNEIFNTTGNITINSGGTLILNNTKLRMNNTINNSFIFVNGGRLDIVNKSNISSNATNVRFLINVTNGRIDVNNSYLSQLGNGSAFPGLNITSSLLNMYNSTVNNSYAGVTGISTNNLTINGSAFGGIDYRVILLKNVNNSKITYDYSDTSGDFINALTGGYSNYTNFSFNTIYIRAAGGKCIDNFGWGDNNTFLNNSFYCRDDVLAWLSSTNYVNYNVFSNNSLISGVTSFSINPAGFRNAVFDDNWIRNSSLTCFYFSGGNNNNLTFRRNICNVSASTADGIDTTDSNATFIEGGIYNTSGSAATGYDIIFSDSTGNSFINMINVSFNKSNVLFSAGSGRLNVSWYADIYVNDSSGNPLENVNVTFGNTSAYISRWNLTNSSGYTTMQILQEYTQTRTGGVANTSNYTFNATLAGYNDNKTWSMITRQKKVIITMSPAAAGVTYNVTLNQSIAGGTTTGKGYTATRNIKQGLIINSIITDLEVFYKNLYQGIKINQLAGKSVTLFKNIYQGVIIGQFASKTTKYLKTIYQGVVINQAAGKIVNYLKYMYQRITIGSSLTRLTSLTKTLYQSITINNFASKTATLFKSFWQGIIIGNWMDAAYIPGGAGPVTYPVLAVLNLMMGNNLFIGGSYSRLIIMTIAILNYAAKIGAAAAATITGAAIINIFRSGTVAIGALFFISLAISLSAYTHSIEKRKIYNAEEVT